MKPKTIFVDMDDTINHYSQWYRKKKMKHGLEYPQSMTGFYQTIPAMDEGIIGVKRLIRAGHDVYIATAPSYLNIHCYTEKRLWVETHFGLEFTKRLIIIEHKGLLKGDYLIDDHKEGRGQENFKGKFMHFGKASFPNWAAILDHFDIV